MANDRSRASRVTLAGGHRVAGRYRIERMLGRGGSATVYDSVDEQTDTKVALKQLLADSDFGQRALFQREYYTLAQMSHPGVIRVFDYGVTEDGPYYTMELLDGSDLSELAPLPWAETCRVLRDVASALAILHSRRLLHRDVSHRNVRMTAAGHPKLIDFGAMAPMGWVPELIGTPPFLSPEAADGEALDQRSDLYALGALGYWLLTGRHLYPAKSVRALRALWEQPLTPQFPDEVPMPLRQLLVALVQRDTLARPGSAAEVIDRVSAIAGLPAGDDSVVAHSYLHNPKLIGRQAELQVLKLELERAAAAQRGTTLAIRGTYGAGKSRLLQELVLHAKFAGFTVLQASAHAGGAEPYAVAIRLVDELLHKLPQAANAALTEERKQVLAWAIPQLRVAGGVATAASTAPQAAAERHARTQAELAALLLAASAGTQVLLAIDDLHACDEESLAVLLALGVGGGGPAIVATLHDAATLPSGARLLAARAAQSVELRPLEPVETERLVESLFGSSPASQRVAGWMQEHAHGNPLECMELARYLVERRAAYYMDGAWMLPHELPAGVPRGLTDGFRARVAGLEPATRAVAELLALYAKPAPLALCVELSGKSASAGLFGALNELVRAELVSAHADRYAVSREGLRQALLEGLTPERRADLHQRIGETLAARGLGDAVSELDAGHHLMRGHERERGVVLVEQAMAREDALAAIGEAVVPALELALALAEAQGAEPSRCMRLRARLVGCAYLYEKRLIAYVEPLLEQLPRDGGIGLMRELPGDALERLARAMQQAQQRHDATPREQRGLPPLEALIELGGMVGSTLAVAIFGYDIAMIDRLAALVAPFGELDERHGLRLMHDLVQVIAELMAGRVKHARELRSELIARLRDPQRYLGVPDGMRKSIIATQLHSRGMREAIAHTGRALALADEIDALGMKMYVGAAQQIRLLAYLYRGDVEAAKRCQLRLDSVSLQGGAGRQTEIWLLGYLVGPYALWGDVIALKRTAERLAALVPDNPGYRPQLYIALGAYYRERGQIDASKNALERALQLAGERPFTHRVLALSQKVETLVAAGEWAAAIALAEQCFGKVADDETDPDSLMEQLLPALALAQARLGNVDAAAGALDAGIALAQVDDRPLAFQGKLYEARARVAILADDRAAFEHCERRTAELYRALNNSVLLLKHLGLLGEAAQFGFGALEARAPRTDVVSMPTVQERRSGAAETVTHEGDAERFERALALLLDCTSAAAGVLLASSGAGLRLAASSAGERVDEALLEAARSFAARALQTESQHSLAASETASWTAKDGRRYQMLPLTAAGAQAPVLSGVALLRAADDTALRVPSASLLGAVARAVQEAAELSTARPLGDWLAM